MPPAAPASKRPAPLPSFSRPGNPYANAQAEAGWSTLKLALLPGRRPVALVEEARLAVAWYLDTYFNLDRHRRHAALGYPLPTNLDRTC